MKTKLIIAIAIIIAGIAIIGGVVYFGNSFSSNPRAVVTRAALKTMEDVKSPDHSLIESYTKLKDAPWQQEVMLSISKPGGSLMPEIDPRVISILDMITFKYNTRYNATEGKRADHLAAQLAVTTMAEIEIQYDVDELALRVPQVFDYYVSLDPRHVVQEWDNSLLGRYLFTIDGNIIEDAFYEYYQQFLFPERTADRLDFSDFATHIGILDDGAEYTSLGDDWYLIVVQADAVNAFWKAVDPFSELSLPEDDIGRVVNEYFKTAANIVFDTNLLAKVKVEKGKIAAINLETIINQSPVTLDIQLKGDLINVNHMEALLTIDESEIKIELQSSLDQPNVFTSIFTLTMDDIQLHWDIRWDKLAAGRDNTNLLFSVKHDEGTFEFYAVGTLRADDANNVIDAIIINAGVKFDTTFGSFESSFDGRYTLRADNESIVFGEGRRPLSTINELDVIGMMGKLMSHPQLGELLSGILPF